MKKILVLGSAAVHVKLIKAAQESKRQIDRVF